MGRSLFIALVLCILAPVAGAQTSGGFDTATSRITAVADELMKLPGAPPGYAVVMVERGQAPVVLVYGVRNTETRRPATADTPFYIASITKSYTGLLAAELDRRGVLSLEASLADIWPDLVLSDGLEPGALSLRHWMVHQAPIANETLQTRTAYIDRVPASEYPAVLAAYSDSRQAGFDYSNTGYLVYGAALEHRTGHSLEWWLSQEVLRPLGLQRTFMRTSAVRDVWGHQRTNDGWLPIRPKPSALMHAAGGLVASPNDVGAWMLANIDPTEQDALAEAIATAQTAVGPLRIDRRGFDCDGYSLGWYHCSYSGIRLLTHGGGYTGISALVTISPEAGIGIALLSNSETAGLSFNSRLTREFFDAWAGAEQPNITATVAVFADEIARLAQASQQRTIEEMAAPRWGGWIWSPTRQDLAEFRGRFMNERLGELVVGRTGDRLEVSLGYMRATLRPATQDLFATILEGDERPQDQVQFERDQSGDVSSLVWGEDRFLRR